MAHSTAFLPGAKVRVDDRPSQGHCRTPRYLRGKTGVVVRDLGPFGNPEALAYGQSPRPKPRLFQVSFDQHTVWPLYDGPAADTLVADIFDFWLKPAP